MSIINGVLRVGMQKENLRRDACAGTSLMVAITVEVRLETQDGCPDKAKLPFTEELKIHSVDLEMCVERGLETAAC